MSDSWNKSQAEAFLKGEKTFDEIEENATSQPDSASVDSADSNSTATVDEPAKSEEEQVESQDIDKRPEKTSDTVETNRRGRHGQYTEEEKRKHAFAKEKNKRKAVQEKLQSKLKEIEELQNRLKKYEGLTKENFRGDDDAYTDYKIDQRCGRDKVASLQKEYDEETQRMQMEEAQQIAEERLLNAYPDETERNKYQQLIMKAESSFAQMHPEIGYEKFSDFLQSEKDRTLLQYLQDSDNSPKLIRHFIHKPEVALRIMEMKNPYNKIVELKQLENRMMQHERMMKSRAAVQPKRSLPNTGKVVSSTNSSAVNYDAPWSKADAERYIKNHSR